MLYCQYSIIRCLILLKLYRLILDIFCFDDDVWGGRCVGHVLGLSRAYERCVDAHAVVCLIKFVDADTVSAARLLAVSDCDIQVFSDRVADLKRLPHLFCNNLL